MSEITRATYDQIAPYFAQANAQMIEHVLLAAQNFARHIPPGEPCLDLGCGAGRDLAWFAAQQINILGADFSAGMLAQAKQVSMRPLIQLDIRHLCFGDQSFSGIWSNAALLHIPVEDIQAVLLEIRRVLRPEGWLGLAMQEGTGEQWETNPYHGEAQRLFVRYSSEEMHNRLETAGFRVLETSRNSLNRRNWMRFLAQRVG